MLFSGFVLTVPVKIYKKFLRRRILKEIYKLSKIIERLEIEKVPFIRVVSCLEEIIKLCNSISLLMSFYEGKASKELFPKEDEIVKIVSLIKNKSASIIYAEIHRERCPYVKDYRQKEIIKLKKELLKIIQNKKR